MCKVTKEKPQLQEFLKKSMNVCDFESLSENLDVYKGLLTRLFEGSARWTDKYFGSLCFLLLKLELLNSSPNEFLQKYCPNNEVTYNKMMELQEWYKDSQIAIADD